MEDQNLLSQNVQPKNFSTQQNVRTGKCLVCSDQLVKF